MSTAEVVKKRGRPKRVSLEEGAIIQETAVVKSKKSRTTRKPNTASPIEKPETRDITNDESPSTPAKTIKESKARPAKSVANEIPDGAAKVSSELAEASAILRQTTTFAEAGESESPTRSPGPVKDDSKIRPKEFKAAGTLPLIRGATTPSNSSTSLPTYAFSQSSKSTFLAHFLTETPLAEQPAWSRPKKPATMSTPTPPSALSTTDPALAASAPPGRPNTLSLLSASPLPTTTPGIRTQPAAAMSTKAPTVAPAPAPAPATSAPAPTYTPTQQAAPAPTQPPPPASRPTRLTTPQIPPPDARRGGGGGPKATEVPYAELRRDPKFRALSRRYTALMVGIPVLLVTSYTLYGRYTETLVQRRRGDGEGDGIGIRDRDQDRDRRTINGGV